ncbi:MAG: PKD domain-containing protein, partial [Promethearchaeota archaeon]
FTYTGSLGDVPVQLTWDFGDGVVLVNDSVSSTSGLFVTRVYAVAGNYTVNVTVVDANGDEDTFIDEICVLSPPTRVNMIGIVALVTMMSSGVVAFLVFYWHGHRTKTKHHGAKKHPDLSKNPEHT